MTQSSAKYVPNYDVSFTNGELHQAHGHVTLTMSTWPKYGHRSLVVCELPRLCSYSWPACVCRLTPWVVLFCDDFLCLRSWHQTNQWHESLLPRNLLSFSYSWLVGFCCQIFPICPCQCSVADGLHFFSALLLSLSITRGPGLFLQCTYCCSYGTESCRHTHLSDQLYVYPWDGLEDSLMSCTVSRLCLNVAIRYRFLRMVVLYEYNYRS